MAREKEIKIVLKINLDDFIEKIKEKGFKQQSTLEQTDIYFDTKDRLLYENIAALRLRQINGKDYSFAFKKVFCLKSGEYYVEEIENKFPLKNLSKLKRIFGRINIPFDRDALKERSTITKYLSQNGYYDEQIMPKKRFVYAKGADEIVIDDAENVGVIVELECTHNDPFEVVKTILKDDEWERSLEGTSYIWLKNVKGLTSHLKNLEKFKTEPDWNVWKNERKAYLKFKS